MLITGQTVHALGRLGRTVRDTLNLIHDLAGRGIGIRNLADRIRVVFRLAGHESLSTHDVADQVLAYLDAAAHEIGLHPAIAIGGVRPFEGPAHQPGQLLVAHGPGRG